MPWRRISPGSTSGVAATALNSDLLDRGIA